MNAVSGVTGIMRRSSLVLELLVKGGQRDHPRATCSAYPVSGSLVFGVKQHLQATNRCLPLRVGKCRYYPTPRL